MKIDSINFSDETFYISFPNEVVFLSCDTTLHFYSFLALKKSVFIKEHWDG